MTLTLEKSGPLPTRRTPPPFKKAKKEKKTLEKKSTSDNATGIREIVKVPIEKICQGAAGTSSKRLRVESITLLSTQKKRGLDVVSEEIDLYIPC